MLSVPDALLDGEIFTAESWKNQSEVEGWKDRYFARVKSDNLDYRSSVVELEQ